MTEDLSTRPLQSDKIDQLIPALIAAQGEMEHAEKARENTHFKSRYADLASVLDAVRPVFLKHGLAVNHRRQFDAAGGEYLITTLYHTSGQWQASYAPLRPIKNDPQGMGSAITYARRYELSAIAGVAAEDDDGNKGSEKGGTGSREPAKFKPHAAEAVFNGEPQLLTFQTAVRRDFTQAQSVADLEALAKRDREVVERLFKSPVAAERDAAQALAADYNDRLKQLQAAPPKVKTVEDALNDDSVPF